MWTFSIAIDSSNCSGTNYLDVRIRFYFNDEIQNFHVCAIPIFSAKSSSALFQLCVRLLDVMRPNWRDVILSFSSDGEPTMTGIVSGVSTLFKQEVNERIRDSFFKIWCGLHQLDLLVQRVYRSIEYRAINGNFVETLTKLISYLRRQQNFCKAHGVCPKLVTTRWASMERVLRWLVDRKLIIIDHLNQKKPDCSPAMQWWVLVVCVNEIANEIALTVRQLQGAKVVVGEQKEKLKQLGKRLSQLCEVSAPGCVEDDESVVYETRSVLLKDARQFIGNMGIFVQDAIGDLDAESVHFLTKSVSNILVKLVSGVDKLSLEFGTDNPPLPICFPNGLSKMSGADFSSLLRSQIPRLQASMPAVEVEEIETDHKNFIRECRRNDVLRRAVDQQLESEDFSKCWDEVRGVGTEFDFAHLRKFGLANMIPNTACVESDFSILKHEKDNFRDSLTNFSLEGVLHCKQYTNLAKLTTR